MKIKTHKLKRYAKRAISGVLSLGVALCAIQQPTNADNEWRFDPRIIANVDGLKTTWNTDDRDYGGLPDREELAAVDKYVSLTNDADMGSDQYINFGNYWQSKGAPEFYTGGQLYGLTGESYTSAWAEGQKYRDQNNEVYLYRHIDYYDCFFKIEPVKWRILAQEEPGELFIQSDKIIEASPLKYAGNNLLADKLNNEMLGELFSASEQDILVDSSVTYDNWINEAIASSVPLTKKLFLLSGVRDSFLNATTNELRNPNYGFAASFEDSETRVLQATEHALSFLTPKSSVQVDGYVQGKNAWYTRSTCVEESVDKGSLVGVYGGINEVTAASVTAGVAPACRINLSTISFFSAAESAAFAGTSGGIFKNRGRWDKLGMTPRYVSISPPDAPELDSTDQKTITAANGITITMQGVMPSGGAWSYSRTITGGTGITVEEVNQAARGALNLDTFNDVLFWAEIEENGVLIASAPQLVIEGEQEAASAENLGDDYIPKNRFAFPGELSTTWRKDGQGTMADPSGRKWKWHSDQVIDESKLGVGQHIYFGSYPQSEYNGVVTANIAQGVQGTADDGTKIVRMGLDGNKKYFAIEPICWRILSNDGVKLILHAENILDCDLKFHTDANLTEPCNRWDETRLSGNPNGPCALQKWLTSAASGAADVFETNRDNRYAMDGFLKNAFTDEEQGLMLTQDILCEDTTLQARFERSIDGMDPLLVNMDFHPGDWQDYDDRSTPMAGQKVWFLGINSTTNSLDGLEDAEIGMGVLNDSSRIRQKTDYALSLDDGANWWWTGSVSAGSIENSARNGAWAVQEDGGLFLTNQDTALGIVPTIALDLIKLNLAADIRIDDDGAGDVTSPEPLSHQNASNMIPRFENAAMFGSTVVGINEQLNNVIYTYAPADSTLVVVATFEDEHVEYVRYGLGDEGDGNKPLTFSAPIAICTWIEKEDDGVRYSTPGQIKIPKYEVKFDLNDESTDSTYSTLSEVEHGSKITAPAPNPEREGYTFGGWYIEPECTNEWDFDEDEVKEDRTLYAKWDIITYDVTFDLNDESTDSTYSTLNEVEHGSKITAPAPGPEREGYTFGGWYTEPECTNQWNFSQDIVKGNLTLYAKWEEIIVVDAPEEPEEDAPPEEPEEDAPPEEPEVDAIPEEPEVGATPEVPVQTTPPDQTLPIAVAAAVAMGAGFLGFNMFMKGRKEKGKYTLTAECKTMPTEGKADGEIQITAFNKDGKIIPPSSYILRISDSSDRIIEIEESPSFKQVFCGLFSGTYTIAALDSANERILASCTVTL